MKQPMALRAQQATFSSYESRNTVTILVGSTPGGLVNCVSDAYGRCTSDQQIVERSNIVQLCEPGNSVMADKVLMYRICLQGWMLQSTYQHFLKREI